MKKIFVLLFLFSSSIAYSLTFKNGEQVGDVSPKSLSINHKGPDEKFCLPKDIASGGECEWAVSDRVLGTEHQIKIVSKEDGHPVRDGNLSLRFEVRPGECAAGKDENKTVQDGQPNNDCTRSNGKSERAELFNSIKWHNGNYWYAWSLLVHQDFEPLNIGSSLKVFQFHCDFNNKYNQHFHFETKDGSYMPFNNISKQAGSKISKRNLIGRWNDILMNVNWSHKDDGFYKVWGNGDLLYEYYGPTIWEKGAKSYMKFGIYRNYMENTWAAGSDGGTTIIYFDEIRIGKSKDEVLKDLSFLPEQAFKYKMSEIDLIEEEIERLKKEVIENYDIEKSKEIKELKRKLRSLRSEG